MLLYFCWRCFFYGGVVGVDVVFGWLMLLLLVLCFLMLLLCFLVGFVVFVAVGVVYFCE